MPGPCLCRFRRLSAIFAGALVEWRARLTLALVLPVLLLAQASGKELPAHPPPAMPSVAPTAILVDADNGFVLYEKSADDLLAPASTAKIMTAAVVFRRIAQGQLSLDQRFGVSEHAWRTGGAPSGGTTMFAVVKSQVRVEDLLRGLIVDSGNDAAIALAEGIAGSEEAFATLMNAQAREIGMVRSTFTNPWGRGDPGQLVTAREMARLALYVIATYPDLYRYFAERDFLWNGIRQTNHDPLLSLVVGADGLKTGELDQSGYGIVGSAVRNGARLVVVLNGMKTAAERTKEAVRLLSWGFDAFDRKVVFQPDEVVGAASVFGGASARVNLVAGQPVRLLVPHGVSAPLTGRIVYDGPLQAPLAAGSIVARLKLTRQGKEVLDVPLRTAESVPTGPLARRALDAGWELMAGFMQTHLFTARPAPTHSAQADAGTR